MKLIIALIVALAAPVVASAQSAPEAKPKDQLTDFAKMVMHGAEPTPISKDLAKYFGMPTEKDDLNIYPINTRRDDGSQVFSYIKPRDSGRIDILFIVSKSMNGKYIYQITADGKLIKAVHLTGGPGGLTPIANDDAQEAFEHEKAFWLQLTKTGNTSAGDKNK
jgi:hypothetical protein